MPDILASFALAFHLIAGGDAELWRIVALSIEVSLASALLACVLGLPLGALVAVKEFAGRRFVVVLLNALASVAPRQRACVVLRFYDDLSTEDTAELLNCSIGTVKSNTARGLAALRRVLGDSTPELALTKGIST